MIKAESSDKLLVINILTKSFDNNRSVNYIIKQDKKRGQRLRHLMNYSFNVCNRFGNIFLSDDKKACVLVLFPDKKKFNLQSLWFDLKLIQGIGLANVLKAMDREALIKKLQPKELLYYLWFIGVNPADQGRGIGSTILTEVILEGTSMQRTICLEASTIKNLSWYEKFGFKIYNEIDFGYRLFLLKKE